MAFFLFIALSSLALPPLNGFIGEFLILIGTFAANHAWAAWATSGSVLSAIYLLWAYQRVALGEVTVEKNRALPDASRREKFILATMSVVIIVMGVASPIFTRRMAASTDNVLQMMDQQMNRAAAASRRAPALPADGPHVLTVPPPPQKMSQRMSQHMSQHISFVQPLTAAHKVLASLGESQVRP
jgi:NADH-quinone oxidoreductase subunit M